MRLVYRVAAVGHKCPTAVPWIVGRIFQPHTHIFQTVFVFHTGKCEYYREREIFHS